MSLSGRQISSLIGVAVCALILGVLAVPSLARADASPTWAPAPNASQPGGLTGAAMAYDPDTDQLVLYGGQAAGGDSAATWLWNGSSWTEANADSPPGALAHPCLAYDAGTHQLLLYGGSTGSGTNSDETWAWDAGNNSWTELNSGDTADGLYDASMAYDQSTDQMVLFGGQLSGGDAASEIWIWQPGPLNWSDKGASVAGGVYGAAMAYDPSGDQMVLFGGTGSGAGSPSDPAGTWIWNGSDDDWMDTDPSPIPGNPFYDGSIAYDPVLGQLVLYGGTNGTADLDDTWSWNGSNWSLLQSDSPPGAYAGTAMAYDASTDQLVLYGGYNSSADPAYSNQTWLMAPPAQPTNVSVQAGTSAGQPSVTVSWNPASEPSVPAVSEYEVFRGTTSGGESLLATLPAGDTSFTDSALTAGDTYYYYVEAVNQSGDSPPSSEVTATTQALSFTDLAPSSVVVGQSFQVAATSSLGLAPVDFSVDPASASNCALSGDTVTATSPGTCQIDASQPGTSQVTPAQASQSVTVSQAPTATSVSVGAKSITARVSVSPPGAGTPTGTVIFSVGGMEVGTAAVRADGTAVLHYGVPSRSIRSVRAAYSGDSDFTSSVGPSSGGSPFLAYTISSAHSKTRYGWYRSAVKLTFHCVVTGAALTGPCPAPVKLTASRAHQAVRKSIRTANGQTAAVSVSGINIDSTRPRVRLLGPVRDRVYAAAPRARCVASDRVSGLASCRLTEIRSGAKVTYTALATSRSGTTAAVRVTVRLSSRN
ncbi:MAG TPA: Ig-like domain repeat protein [Solirubrobacteraceae bacterium]|nr:Ig-like domain repeat protein [Solirubrobacteraceae bacterium]